MGFDRGKNGGVRWGFFFFSSGGSLFGKLSMMGLVDQKITGEEEEWRGKLEYESLRLFSRVGLK